MRLIIATLLLALAAAMPARAAFDELGVGARAPGMGDAFTALADDAYAPYYNPAGLAQIDRGQLSAAYSRLYVGLGDGSDIGSSQIYYAMPLSRGKKNRTLGFGLNRLSLSSLYVEQTLTGAFGMKVLERESGSQLMVGLSAKYLTRSFTAPAEAENACAGLSCNQGADPVLSGPKSKSTYDADLGFLYRLPKKFQIGLSVQHLMAPNVAFSGSDKLERSINLGLAYKSLWMSLLGEIRTKKTSSGASGRDYVFAAERYYPTLDYGQFGLRGSLGMGSDEWRQMTFGASYRVNKIQTDYAYMLPVGAVKGNSGTHRVSLSFHFGAPTGEEEISRDLLEQAKRLREHGPEYGYEYSQELKPQDLSDPRLAEVRTLIEDRKYRLAQKALSDYALKQPLSAKLLRLSNRLTLVAYFHAELPAPQDKYDTNLVASLRSFLYGDDRLSLLHGAYAFSMKPEDARTEHLLAEIEKAVGLKADRLPPDHPRSFIDEMLYRQEFANTRGDAGRVESLLKDVLTLEPENPTALERLGSLRFMAGRYIEANQAWEAALKLETREKELVSLREYLKVSNDRLSGKKLPGDFSPTVPAAPEPEPVAEPEVDASTAAATEPAAKAAPRPAPKPRPIVAPPIQARPIVPTGDTRDVQALYQKGVEHYARGEYLQASAMFLQILQIDPNNEQARKALERIGSRTQKP
jgi:tetratricopeptide (TPR) repeat protein